MLRKKLDLREDTLGVVFSQRHCTPEARSRGQGSKFPESCSNQARISRSGSTMSHHIELLGHPKVTGVQAVELQATTAPPTAISGRRPIW
jgi:hypothetical protein